MEGFIFQKVGQKAQKYHMGRLQQRWRLCSHTIPSPKADRGRLEAELVGIVLCGGTKVWKYSLGKAGECMSC